ncbi:MAG TPA: hypothetical protein VEC06_05280 [Paucimonas sp.]|nr:hypothetical protein [Paucimonas sp.]
MQLTVSVDSIYQGSIARLSASSQEQFKVASNCKVLSCAKGLLSPSEIEATEDKGKFQIEVNLLEALKERTALPNSEGSASRYGMSYFPFISSHFTLKLSLSVGLSDLVVEFPSNFRVIWQSNATISPSKEKSSLSTSYSEKFSTYIFSWNTPQPAGEYIIEFDVRTGGPGLLKSAYFPIYYYLIAMVAVAAAATAEHTNIFLGALATAWVFLLRHVNSCDIPRRNVLLFHATVLFGAFLLIWGITWRLNRFYYNEWIIAIEAVIAAAAIWLSLRAVRLFEAAGTLPAWLTHSWGRFVRSSEKRQLH